MGLVLLFGVLFVATDPNVLYAQVLDFEGDTGGIVPCAGADCNACDLVTLAQNIINFAVYISIFVATLMFVWAGFLYITAGGDSGKIKNAHMLFWKVLVGMVIVLAAWLIVDAIMKVLFNDDGYNAPWNKILCTISGDGGRSNTLGSGNPGDDLLGESGDTGNDLEVGKFPSDYVEDTRTAQAKAAEEDELRRTVSSFCSEPGLACKTSVNTGSCAPNAATRAGARCTDISRMNDDMFNIIKNVAQECGASEFGRTNAPNTKCGIVITGGSELGAHSTRSGCASGAGTHCAGDKVDMRASGAVRRYVQDNDYFRNPTTEERQQRQCNRAGARVQKSTGACWVLEGGGSQGHYDVARNTRIFKLPSP